MNALLAAAVIGCFGIVFGAESCCAPPRYETRIGEWGGAVRKFGHPTVIYVSIVTLVDSMLLYCLNLDLVYTKHIVYIDLGYSL